MITRIVKMTFDKNHSEDFLSLFREIAPTIRSFRGCRELKLLRDKNDPNTFFTWSSWESEEDLQNYRNSAFFADTWPKTKKLFAQKPEAWTVEVTENLE